MTGNAPAVRRSAPRLQMKRLLLFALAGVCSLQTAAAATFTVLNTNDTGVDSLRAAILSANATAEPDTIVFLIPPSDPNRNATTGVCIITPASALPAITNPVLIDGYTQPGAAENTFAIGNNAVLQIELNGTSAQSSGLTLVGTGPNSPGSTIRGLVINRFRGDFYNAGIFIRSDNNVVAGNFIGTDPTGNTPLGNNTGVRVGTGANNLIGGTTPAARNLISGHAQGGNAGNITVENSFGATAPPPTGTAIRGNYIGTNAAGTAALITQGIGNSPGVVVLVGTGTIIGGSDADDGALDGNVGARNIISGNFGGISTVQNAGSVPVELTVQGNFIGVNATGQAAIPNLENGGIRFNPPQGSASSILVGGTVPGAGNVISGNTGFAGNGVSSNARRVVVQGNRIGTDMSGTLNLGNGAAGVEALNSNDTVRPEVIIGGAAPGAGNIISASGTFGIVSYSRLAGPTVQGNLIGTAADGVTPLGNRFNGIRVNQTAVIGGTAVGEGNVIAFNYLGDGVFGMPRGGILLPFDDQGRAATGVRILGNSIFGNGGLGITLGGGGTPRLNDPGDADNGPNNFQNFPVLTSARTTPEGLNVRGTLNSQPNAPYRIEFFGNNELDATLYGEGRTFLGSIDVTTDANGNASFDAPVASGTLITSTATDASGNTSEFSQSIGQLLNISTRLRVRTGENVLIGGFIVTGSDPKRVLLRGIGPSLAGRGISDGLQDPMLELVDANGEVLAANDNWKESQQSEIQATTIPPPDDRESAIVRTVPAGSSAYTAVVRGKNDTTGTALVEVYDLDQAANSKLANISTRGLVETGNSVLIGGFIAGNGVVKVIVRALGPSLTGAGVTNPLQDPILDVRDANGTLTLSNDSWRSTQEAEILATGIPPSNDAEAAIVATLPPAPYTAIIRGKNDTTGVALVEVYALD